MSPNKRLFLTGGTGFIGRSFLRHCQHQDGVTVIALCRDLSALSPELKPLAEWVPCNLQQITANVLKGSDVLVHLAAHGVHPKANVWDDCLRINCHASHSLFQAALAAGVPRIVATGSMSEYGISGEKYDFIPETAPLCPVDPYGASKAMATICLLTLARQRRCEAAVLRLFHTYGEGEADHRFWPSLKAAALSGQDFAMTAGEQIRDFSDVSDVVAEIFNYAVGIKLVPGKPVVKNVGSGQAQTLLRFAQYWWNRWDAKGRLRPGAIEYRPNEVMRYVPQITKS